ncbi:bacteriocin immunity protein [Companilactobacillus baiquanensis]|uniref:Bacteriocin immunity protein n=1 Tax=Companilactobacillus baiquanensis TaxID=2486005 RepID=A0ABW1UUY0_9LACO|nr:bacteriocin immunity protein [Companilactobacillus baiquanensis]
MSKDKDVELMLDQISKAYSDEEIKKLPAAKKMLLKYATQLEKDNYCDLVATKLCKEISLYYFKNKENFPKALVELYGQLKPRAVKYDAEAVASFMLPIWF